VRIARTAEEVRREVAAARAAGRTVAMVPTMGSLHEGHLSLVRLAAERASAGGRTPFVVLTVFVNPTQFAPGEDFEAYPRDLGRDAELAEAEGVDLVFAPEAREMYPDGFRTKVRVEELSAPLCGRGRPGHFDGVALVVTKLANIVQPDLSVYGRKDAQQALLIRRLARDLDLPGEIVLGETVREPDGLAMSSRNVYLSPEERRAAVAIPRGLSAARRAWGQGERDPERLVARVREELDGADLLEPEYVEIVDRETLAPWAGEGAALLAVAVRLPSARLIDNVWLDEPDRAGPEAASGAGVRTGGEGIPGEGG
jgi:pantoate--beta-alanine ligase